MTDAVLGMSVAATVGPLFTDLYELTMGQAYLRNAMRGEAVFETFFREMPATRRYAIAAGVDEVLGFLESLHFTDDDVAFLRTIGGFEEDFLRHLRALRFTGDVWAMPEGTIVFPHEPIVQVVAPILEAQLVETFVLNRIHLETVLASKATRVVEAAAGRTVVDFGARRAHGADAALAAARASFLAGADGTSNVLAGRRYGIPVFGTMAHSFIQAFDTEVAAFEAFMRLYPETTLLVDTYDTLEAVERVIALARRLGAGFRVRAIRLDSGDLGQLAARARARLDGAGLGGVRIFASSGLDEHEIARLVTAGAPIDAFGVGTKMALSRDAPELDMAYKLVAYQGRGRTKLSHAKVLYPGRKQVYREVVGGRIARDTIARFDERCAGEPLLVPVMVRGRRVGGASSLAAARRRCSEQRALLPDDLRRIDGTGSLEAQVSQRVMAELHDLARTHGASAAG